MAYNPNTSCQINGETMETMRYFIFLDSKITVDGDCSHEIERHLLLGRKARRNLDSVLKSRDITLPTKVHLGKTLVFSSSHCERWIIEKVEQQRIDVFELWYWRRLLRVPWTARRSKQSILKENNSEYSLEGLMLKPKLQYLGLLMQKTNSLGKDPDAGKDWRQKEKGAAENEIDSITDSIDMNLSKLWEIVEDRGA